VRLVVAGGSGLLGRALGGQRVAPDRALALGYGVAFAEPDRALRDLLA